MGALLDKARTQSNFLIIEKGSKAIVQYIDFRFIPSNQDPTKDVVQYKVKEDGKEKYWSNGSGKVMRYMDQIKKGAWILISRNSWINKDGIEDTGKSSYEVVEVDERGKVVKKPAETPVKNDKKATPEEQAVWNE